MTLDAFQGIAERIAGELPREFFNGLTGGISISPNVKYHAKSNPIKPLQVLGEYHRGSGGRYIILYYGSFLRAYGNMDEQTASIRIRDVILHEFRHHLESLAGERGLEVEDAIRQEEYCESLQKMAQPEAYPVTVHYAGKGCEV